MILSGLFRLLFRRPCEICGDRRRCWRWHVEYVHCPTCGTEVDEFDPRCVPISLALLHRSQTQTGNFGSGYSYTFTIGGG